MDVVLEQHLNAPWSFDIVTFTLTSTNYLKTRVDWFLTGASVPYGPAARPMKMRPILGLAASVVE